MILPKCCSNFSETKRIAQKKTTLPMQHTSTKANTNTQETSRSPRTHIDKPLRRCRRNVDDLRFHDPSFAHVLAVVESHELPESAFGPLKQFRAEWLVDSVIGVSNPSAGFLDQRRLLQQHQNLRVDFGNRQFQLLMSEVLAKVLT